MWRRQSHPDFFKINPGLTIFIGFANHALTLGWSIVAYAGSKHEQACHVAGTHLVPQK
jgi:hypothetical protein